MRRPAKRFARESGSFPPADNVRELSAGIELEDAELVERACEGDRWAEEVLYHRHVAYITGMVTRCLGSRDEAEDVVQDTFAIGLDKLRDVRRPEAVRGWFAQIAIRLVRRRIRRGKLFAALGITSPRDYLSLEAHALPESDPETRAELAAVDRVLRRLPTEHRLAWMLRYFEGEPLEEVARICGCSLATAKRRIAAAAAHLRTRLDTIEEEP
jgi:RNA polymerase sigma-70 factor (ECF subfamily)